MQRLVSFQILASEVNRVLSSLLDSIIMEGTDLMKFNSHLCVYKRHLSDFSISSQPTLNNFKSLWKIILHGFEHRVQVLISTFYLNESILL